MKRWCFPEIPTSWIVCVIFIGLVILRAMDIDTYVTAGISLLIGYITGKHVEQTRGSNGKN